MVNLFATKISRYKYHFRRFCFPFTSPFLIIVIIELHERQAYDKFHAKFSSSSREHPKQRPQTKAYGTVRNDEKTVSRFFSSSVIDNHGSDLPLDAIDYKVMSNSVKSVFSTEITTTLI